MSAREPVGDLGFTRTGGTTRSSLGEWEVGRIYQNRGGPDSLRWFWSMPVTGPMTRSDRVATSGGQGTVSEELGRLEGVGEAGRGGGRITDTLLG